MNVHVLVHVLVLVHEDMRNGCIRQRQAWSQCFPDGMCVTDTLVVIQPISSTFTFTFTDTDTDITTPFRGFPQTTRSVSGV